MNKKLMKLMPYIQYNYCSGRYFDTKFKPEDVKKNKIEIPLLQDLMWQLSEGQSKATQIAGQNNQ